MSKHVYQSRPGDGDSNVDCECDIGYSHDKRPNWSITEAYAYNDIRRIHAEALTGPLSEADRQIVLAEVARVQSSDEHLSHLIGLLLHVAADLEMNPEGGPL